jgi:hypothetical protein
VNLDEYIKSDDNDFWKLSPGEMQVLLDESVERIEDLEKVLADWLDCFDTPEEWMRCRNNAKLALGRDDVELFRASL